MDADKKHQHTCGKYAVLDLCAAGSVQSGSGPEVVQGVTLTPEMQREILMHIGLMTDETRAWIDEDVSPMRNFKMSLALDELKDQGPVALGCAVCREWFANATTAALLSFGKKDLSGR